MRILLFVLLGVAVTAMIGIVAFPMLIMASLRGSPPTFLFSYNVEMVASFKVDGQPVEARRVAKCAVMKGGGGLSDTGADTSAVFVRVSEGDNAYVVLADGSAIIFYDMPPCLWKKAPPKPGKTYVLVPDDKGVNYRKPPDGDAYTFGRVAWLRSGTKPAPIEYFTLMDFAGRSTPRVTDFSLRLSATNLDPTVALADDIPIVRQLTRSVTYFLSDDEKQQHGRNLVLSPWTAIVGQLAAQTQSEDCTRTIASLGGRAGWIPIKPQLCRGGGTTNVALAISSDLSRVDLDLQAPPRPGRLSLTIAALDAANVPVWLEVATGRWGGPLYYWIWRLCAEGQCLEIAPKAGYSDGFEFYHPATGRLLRLYRDTDATRTDFLPYDRQ